jgi:release factor glutamine methyltransferase
MSPAAEKRWTILDVLTWTADRFAQAGIASPRIDADVLLADSLGLDRMQLYLQFDRPLDPPELSRYRDRVRRRIAREPVAYITGTREFFSLPFAVDARVLVPRPETETLVERALELLAAIDAPRIADVGTGSGAIAVAIAKHKTDATVDAIDVDENALVVARINAATHDVAGRVTARTGDLLKGVADRSLDMVVSNPPYLTASEWAAADSDVRDHEPPRALVAGEDGLDVIRPLVAQAAGALVSGGWLLVEIGAGQGQAAVDVVNGIRAFGRPEVLPDLARRDRVLCAKRQ